MSFISTQIINQRRIIRSGRIKQNEQKLKQINDNPFAKDYELRKAEKLSKKIGKDKERNKIASENNSRTLINKSHNNYNLNLNNNKKTLLGINLSLFKSNKKNKQKRH